MQRVTPDANGNCKPAVAIVLEAINEISRTQQPTVYNVQSLLQIEARFFCTDKEIIEVLFMLKTA